MMSERETDRQPWGEFGCRLATVVVAAAMVNLPVGAHADPAESEPLASSPGLENDEGWRVQTDDKPPVQVRRAVDAVIPTARAVAERVSRGRGGGSGSDIRTVPRAAQKDGGGPADNANVSGGGESDRAVAEGSSTGTSSTGSESDGQTVLASTRSGASDRPPISNNESLPAPSTAGSSDESASGTTWSSWANQLWSQGATSWARTQTSDETSGVLSAEPYVEDQRWRRAMQLLERGDCKESLDRVDAVIDESDRDLKELRPVRYAVGRIKMCTPGYGGQGRETMRALAAGDDVVAELARRRLGLGRSPVSAYVGGGASSGDDTSTSLPSYILNETSSSPASSMTTNEAIRKARSLARQDETDEAVRTLQRFRADADDEWSQYRTYEVQGSLLWRAGRHVDAGRAFRGAYRVARAWDRGGDLEDRLERLQSRSDVQILTMGSRIDRMRELIADGEYHLAKQVSIHNADVAGVTGREIEGWSYYRRGLEAERQRDRDRAIDLFNKAETRVTSDVIRPRLYYGWARALRRVGDDPKAIALYERLCREYPQHHLCDDARYQAGRLSMYDNRFEQARGFFVDLMGLHPESPHHAGALWLGGFSAYLAGDYEAAIRPLRVLEKRYGDQLDSSGTSMAVKSRYWQAVATLKQGDHDAAEDALQELINDNPLSWYGRLAAARLEQIGVAPVVPVPPSTLNHEKLTSLRSLGLPDHPKYQVAKEYAKLGLFSDAAEDIKRQLRVEPSPPGARHLLATLWLLSGDIHRSHWMMNDYVSPRGPTLFDLRTWGLAYPVEYLEASHKWGRKYDVNPLLIQSVIRQESGFRAEVDSYAGAVGLMQLMPGTANYASDEWFDGAWVSRSELRTPDVNVRFGSAYLRAMLGHTQENVPMALAGYNAGPSPMRRWFQDYGDRQVDAWVESLTYEQARGYVRKVYTNYVRYMALYAGDNHPLPTPSLQLPSELAPWGEAPELQQTPKAVGMVYPPFNLNR